MEIVRKALDAYPRRDIEAMRAVSDPDVVLDWSASEGWMAGVYRGFAEVDRVWEGLWGAFEEIVIEPERYMVAGESVVVPNVSHQRGRDGIADATPCRRKPATPNCILRRWSVASSEHDDASSKRPG